jgi:cysteinyl-tRNA synthetase
MSTKYLGNPFDFHGGGKDLIFPHHENERAQTECATGKKFVNYWVHNGFVTMQREKMSKSVGNILTIKDFLKKYHPEVLRLFFLSTHYRNPIDYKEQSLENAEGALQRLYYTLQRIQEMRKGSVAAVNETEEPSGQAMVNGSTEIQEIERRFHEAMSDDFNTALALSALFDLSRVLNRIVDERDESSRSALAQGERLFASIGSTLGLLSEPTTEFGLGETLRHLARVGLDEKSVQAAIQDRTEARKRKDYKRADEIRDELLEKGIALLDTPSGTTWRAK